MKPITLGVYLLGCLAFLLTLHVSPYPGSVVVKAFPILLLAGVAWSTLQGHVRTLMSAALVLSAGGDVFLEMDLFTPGLGSFLVAQLCYAWYFFSQRSKNTIPYKRLLVVFAIMSSVSIPVISNAGELTIPVAVYMAAICMMGIGAALYRQPSTIVFCGALLFVVSDSLIGINRFVTPLPAADYGIMITYYAAQLVIFWGVLQAQQHPAEDNG